jgi:hypothetical protein
MHYRAIVCHSIFPKVDCKDVGAMFMENDEKAFDDSLFNIAMAALHPEIKDSNLYAVARCLLNHNYILYGYVIG